MIEMTILAGEILLHQEAKKKADALIAKLKGLYYVFNVQATVHGANVDAASFVRKPFTMTRLENEGFQVEDVVKHTRTIRVKFNL